MKGPIAVRYSAAARDDLFRLYEFLLDRAQTAEDFDAAQSTIDALRREVEQHLSHHPFICRKVGDNPFLRELIIPFRRGGYVALFEIEDAHTVSILALRHQREEDYH